MIDQVKLLAGAQDINGIFLPIDEIYILVSTGYTHSILENRVRKQYYVNNKYIDFKSE
ncbi:hypothetical protein [uncultured Thomasclavelia sp.]|uniref:hypothetical protein n=1 Tax=uncultured Thomasclavelia sp. TaxID=3025759 RepID=UPI0025E04AF0|nr:hypothetical protein [uncultured Thomasclavelia sp.]